MTLLRFQSAWRTSEASRCPLLRLLPAFHPPMRSVFGKTVFSTQKLRSGSGTEDLEIDMTTGQLERGLRSAIARRGQGYGGLCSQAGGFRLVHAAFTRAASRQHAARFSQPAHLLCTET